MKYAVGSPKSRRKERNQLICDSEEGGGVKKSETFAVVIYGSPLILCRELAESHPSLAARGSTCGIEAAPPMKICYASNFCRTATNSARSPNSRNTGSSRTMSSPRGDHPCRTAPLPMWYPGGPSIRRSSGTYAVACPMPSRPSSHQSLSC